MTTPGKAGLLTSGRRSVSSGGKVLSCSKCDCDDGGRLCSDCNSSRKTVPVTLSGFSSNQGCFVGQDFWTKINTPIDINGAYTLTQDLDLSNCDYTFHANIAGVMTMYPVVFAHIPIINGVPQYAIQPCDDSRPDLGSPNVIKYYDVTLSVYLRLFNGGTQRSLVVEVGISDTFAAANTYDITNTAVNNLPIFAAEETECYSGTYPMPINCAPGYPLTYSKCGSMTSGTGTIGNPLP